MRRSWLWMAIFFVLSGAAVAQMPNAAQIEQFRSLPPAQRDALLAQFGIDPSMVEGMLNSGDTSALGGVMGGSMGGAIGMNPSLNALGLLQQPGPVDPDAEDDAAGGLFGGAQASPATLKFKPSDTVLVTATPNANRTPTTPGEQAAVKAMTELVLRGNPYTLDRAGQLLLPGAAAIALGGLTEEQANKRLELEPSLAYLTVTIVRSPAKPAGQAGLKPFGYNIFSQWPSRFPTASNVPVPAEYVVGPGDRLSVQLFGSQNRTLRLVVDRDGAISFPELGPISVTGKTFETVRADIEARVAKQMIGTQASVSIADTRSIQVFVVGEARRPGSYTVSALSTVTSALYAAGGIAATGSLRDVQLKRQGSTVRRLDLYDLLLRGDTSNDSRILAGDVIFIPPVGPVASVDGEVRRPAIYELKGNVSVADLVGLAGGLTVDADSQRLNVVRRSDDGRRVALDISLADERTRALAVRNGDEFTVSRLRPTLDAGVVLDGHVFRPGTVAWREGLRLTDVLRSMDELKPGADAGYVLIRRELPPDRRIAVLSADIGAALRAPGSDADILLSARDRITVFDIESGRDLVVRPLLSELRRQSTLDRPAEIVKIDGRVKSPGDYPLEPGMRISDLLRAGGRLADEAYGSKAELTRLVSDGEQRRSELLEIDLAAVQRGEPAADIVLKPFDTLIIKELPEWSKQEFVTLSGEVRFPGRYPIRRGETMRSVLERAGGLTGLAFVRGAVFTREELRKREEQQIAQLTERLRSDLAALAVQAGQVREGATASQNAMTAQGMLSQLQGSRALGRLVINLDSVIAGRLGAQSDIVLQDGDQLVIPKIRQEVTVLGEVQNGTSHLYRPDLSRNDYVNLSGGFSRRADTSRTYVVRVDGSVVTREGRWFLRGGSIDIQPGDTIVVPIDTERLPPLPLWQAVTSIIYNSAVALAAVNSL